MASVFGISFTELKSYTYLPSGSLLWLSVRFDFDVSWHTDFWGGILFWSNAAVEGKKKSRGKQM